jgi:hypothetical protein
MTDEMYIEEKVGKRNPFLVPDGYFDHLADQVMASLPEQPVQQAASEKPKAKRIGIRSLYYYAAAAVCAEADIDAGIQHLLCRCKSVAQFHIALGAEGNTDVLFSHNLDIFIRGINAVGRDTGNIELTQGIHILDGRRSVLLRDSVHFRLTFRQMDRLSDSAVFAGPGQFLQVVRHTAVWRMWAVDEAEAALIPEHLHFADSLSVFHN